MIYMTFKELAVFPSSGCHTDIFIITLLYFIFGLNCGPFDN
jgi:hypothetical protein